MSKKLTAYLILICALGLTITAGYYSVVGLTIIFSGTFLPVLIFGSFLELSKVGITTYLHSYWSSIKTSIKTYLISTVIILSLITSLGIYGLLSAGFQKSILQTEINQSKIEMIDKTLLENNNDIKSIQKNIYDLNSNEQNLRQALIDKTVLQSYNNKGQLITKANNGSRQSFDQQLKLIDLNKEKLSNDIRVLNNKNDSLETVKFNITIKDKSAAELTTLKFFSEVTGYDLKTIANIFIFILIFVFDPLAIILILSANNAFKNLNDKKEEDKVKNIEQDIHSLFDQAEVEIDNWESTTPKVDSEPETQLKVSEPDPLVETEPIRNTNIEEVFKLLENRSIPEKINLLDYVLANYSLNSEDRNILETERKTLSLKLLHS